MKKHFIEDVPAVIRQYVPDGENAANILAEILPIGKESIYRRLRGEIPFTFDEVARISLHLGFSIDNIIGQKNSEHILIGVDLFNTDDLIKLYKERLESQIKIINQIKKGKKCKISCAVKNVPYIMAVKYENLCDFSFYKWYYQTRQKQSDFLFSDFKTPQSVKDIRSHLYSELQSVPHYEILLDQNVFSEIRSDLNYFLKRNLLNEAELNSIKNDLMNMISDMENWATFGFNEKGSEMHIYLSSVDLDSTYFFYESDGNLYSFLQFFSIHFLQTTDPRMGELQKQWIKSLKRYSVNITQSSEIQRCDYFHNLREIVKNIGIMDK